MQWVVYAFKWYRGYKYSIICLDISGDISSSIYLSVFQRPENGAGRNCFGNGVIDGLARYCVADKGMEIINPMEIKSDKSKN